MFPNNTKVWLVQLPCKSTPFLWVSSLCSIVLFQCNSISSLSSQDDTMMHEYHCCSPPKFYLIPGTCYLFNVFSISPSIVKLTSNAAAWRWALDNFARLSANFWHSLDLCCMTLFAFYMKRPHNLDCGCGPSSWIIMLSSIWCCQKCLRKSILLFLDCAHTLNGHPGTEHTTSLLWALCMLLV